MSKPPDAGADETLGREPTPLVDPLTGVGVGTVLGERYRLLSEVGRGGMGVVYRAHDGKLNEEVAVKLLLGADPDPATADLFHREIRLARRVTHRNVVRVYDLGEHADFLFLTMELIDGKSLAEVLSEHGRLDSSRAVAIAVQICKGLAAAHDAGIIHRDLKPANILLEDSGRAAISDFGIARATDSDLGQSSSGERFLGTPAFMAPEQVQRRATTPRTDIYALGLILYRMLTGRHAFEADSALELALARVQRAPADPRSFVATIPAAMADLVMRCLDFDPQRRPPDVREVGGALLRSGTDVAVAQSVRLDHSDSGSPLPPWVPIEPGGVGLAVLPFRYQGPEEQRYVADALTDELIDVLSMTRGLLVCSRGATERFAQRRDPKAIAEALGVQHVVDASVRAVDDRIRLSVRLVDPSTEFQVWSARFDAELADVLRLQDEIARRLAESLRVELEERTFRGAAPVPALELYLQARALAQAPGFASVAGTIERLERVVAWAPTFKPARPFLASTYAMAWFMPSSAPGVDYEALTTAAVEEALRIAPDLAESHLAAARLAVGRGAYSDGARALAEALHIAPTFGRAHDYLGMIQLECGRPIEGERRVTLAQQIDPTLEFGPAALGRHFALMGSLEPLDRLIEHASTPQLAFVLAMTKLRAAAWRGDLEQVQRLADSLGRSPGSPTRAIGFLGAVLGGAPLPDDILATVGALVGDKPSPRGWTFALQLTAEVLGLRQRPELAMDCLRKAVDNALADVAWVQRCPALDPLRSLPGFEGLRSTVESRAAAIWLSA